MSEYLQLDPSNLLLSTPPKGVTVEYEPVHSGETRAAERGRLENVTLGIIVAVDAALRTHDGTARELQDQVDATHRHLAAEGMIEEHPGPSRREQGDVPGLARLSSQFTRALMRPADPTYSLGGLGSPWGGRNVLGDIAVSRGYEYSSPLGQEANGAHWHKKTLQMVAVARNQLNVSVYSYGNQHLDWQVLQRTFEGSEFDLKFKKNTGLKVANNQQPVTIPTLSASVYGHSRNGESLPSKLALPGLHSYLKKSGLAYTPFVMSEPSEYGASARATLKDPALGLGLSVNINASTAGYDKAVKFDADDDLTSFAATTEDSLPAQLEALRFVIAPIARDHRSPGERWVNEFRQDENIIQRPGLVNAAQRLSSIVLDLHSAIADAS